MTLRSLVALAATVLDFSKERTPQRRARQLQKIHTEIAIPLRQVWEQSSCPQKETGRPRFAADPEEKKKAVHVWVGWLSAPGVGAGENKFTSQKEDAVFRLLRELENLSASVACPGQSFL